MQFRVTDSAASSRLASQVAGTRRQLAAAQEQVASGKRINRPSDDPTGAGAVLRLRSSQAEIEHFRRNTSSARERLTFADASLDSYERTLDRSQMLLAQGASGSPSQATREILAAELEGIRDRMLASANTRIDEQYVFGGTRQTEPPYDPLTRTPSAVATSPTMMQIEADGAPVASGVLAESVFADASGTVFAALDAAAAALRGTGDEAADAQTVRDTIDRLKGFGTQAATARARIGVSIESVDIVAARHDSNDLLLETAALNIEGADFAEAATRLVAANQALEATLQTGAHMGRRTLIDLLG